VELTTDEIRLILDALEEAAVFRDAKSRAIHNTARRRGRGISDALPGEADKQRARDYTALAVRLRQAK
jgi:hypothetical protein